MFLFGARDVWFVVALPVYLSTTLGWDFWQVGGFMAAWLVGYGVVQALAPALTGARDARMPGGGAAAAWGLALAVVPLAMAAMLAAGIDAQPVLVGGLALFGLVFAVNSSLHSYLVVGHAARDGVSLDVGFYYMANAMGRLLGTVLSGWVFQAAGLGACLAISGAFVVLAALVVRALPPVAIPRQAAAEG
jgi:predicted MFS family arabinose efflux permease